MPSLTGQSIGRYHILEQLGEGGMATVYKAYDTRLERDVAIKIIRVGAFPPDHVARILQRFEREAKSLAKLSHFNIIKILDYGEFEGAPYLIMEYMPGGTLKTRLGKPMPWPEAVKLLLPVADALAYAHEQAIVHRDVKPSNILMTNKGQPMLTDFGIAKLVDQGEGETLTGTGVGIGTPEYMAPEQGLGQEIDGRVDVYALGIVLYELVTGRKPYIANTPMAVIYKHLSDPLRPPSEIIPDLPEDVERVIFKALAKEPKDRYASMANFATALENLERLSFHSGAQTAKPAPGPVKVPAWPNPTPASVPGSDITSDTLPESSVSASLRLVKTAPRAGLVRVWPFALGLLMLSILIGFLIFKFAALISPAASKAPSIPLPASTFTTTPTIEVSTSLPPTMTPTLTLTLTPAPTLTPSLGIGSTQTRGRDGMVMVYVPAGPFTMGSSADAALKACQKTPGFCLRDWFLDEEPVHTVSLHAFWIDQTEVTNREYAICVLAGLCTLPSSSTSATHASYYGNTQYDNYPVINVTWDQAKDYCTWTGGHLPTEAEWEKSARGTDGRTFPWGENIDPTYGNYNGKDTSPVKSYEKGKSPYGAYDMMGNVWEMVSDYYSATYYQISPIDNPQGPSDGTDRGVRGGGWVSRSTHSACRGGGSCGGAYRIETGFRCVSDTPTGG